MFSLGKSMGGRLLQNLFLPQTSYAVYNPQKGVRIEFSTD